MKNKSKSKHLYEDSDWDDISKIHMIHRKVTGVPLYDVVLKFYASIFILSIVFSLFLKV